MDFRPIFALLALIQLGHSLECYVCKDQEHNNGKCTKTIQTCPYGQDVCLTEIRWGSMPYWQQGALKQHYISKQCATKEYCEGYRKSNMDTCTHIWYQDWKCSDCCKGDRCNYYVISGAVKTTSITSQFVGLSLISLVLCKLMS